MRIKTRLVLMGLLPLSIGAANVSVISWSERQTELIARNLEVTEHLVSAISDLNLLGSEFQKPVSRARVISQWRQRRGSVATYLGELEADHQDTRLLRALVQENFDELDQLFARLTAAWSSYDKTGEQSFLDDGAIKLLFAQVQTKLRDTLDSTTRFHRQQHQKDLALEAAADAYVFWTAGVSAVIGAWLAVIMGWRIRNGFRQLQEGTEKVAFGNLAYRINDAATDELGALARAFDAMNGRLGALTASRDELDREVLERRRVEDALQELNDSLELTVLDRTRELRDSNAALEAAMAELQAAQAQLIQQEKLSALGTVVAGVAHELNNPLMGILNYVEYARDRAESEGGRKALDKAEHEVRRITGIVRNMLSFSRSGESFVGRADARASLHQALDLVGADLRKHRIVVETALPDELPAVVATADGLQQVFLNLFINARDAMKNADTRQLHIASREAGERLMIDVSDTGPGVSQAVLHRIFDPFFTTKPAGEGTGLGLSVSRNILAGFGGELSYAASPGGGATFTVSLPTAQGSADTSMNRDS